MIFSSQPDFLTKMKEVEGNAYAKILYVNDHIIYGLGGWHRYFINIGNIEGCELNEVVFSAFHSDKAGIEKAKLAGFNIFV